MRRLARAQLQLQLRRLELALGARERLAQRGQVGRLARERLAALLQHRGAARGVGRGLLLQACHLLLQPRALRQQVLPGRRGWWA